MALTESLLRASHVAAEGGRTLQDFLSQLTTLAAMSSGKKEPSLAAPIDDSSRIVSATRWAEDLCAARGIQLPPFEGSTPHDVVAWFEQLLAAIRRAVGYSGMVRYSYPFARAQIDARTGRVEAGTRPVRRESRYKSDVAPLRDKTGKTISAALADHPQWEIVTPYRSDAQGSLQLCLPLETQDGEHKIEPSRLGKLVKTTMTPGVIRAYLAARWETERWDEKHPRHALVGDGIFEHDPKRVMEELFGVRLTERTVNGRTYRRIHSDTARSFEDDFLCLPQLRVAALGNGRSKIIVGEPQPLISVYKEEASGRTLYQHAQVLNNAFKMASHPHFLQVPVQAMRLPTDDIPGVLGVSAIWCDQILRTVLQGPGYYRTTLESLAEELGENWQDRSAKLGSRVYWNRFSEKVRRIMQDGALGHLHVEGADPSADSLVTLTPSQDLVTVYSTMAEAGKRKRERMERIEEQAEAMTRAKTPRKRGPKPRV